VNHRWRHLIPLLPSTSPLFVPDLPGYGVSSPITQNDKVSAGIAILNALKTEVHRISSELPPRPISIILIGHDRGARVAHHLTVQGIAGISILGTCLIDIVKYRPPTIHPLITLTDQPQIPTSTQWQNDSPAPTAAKEITGYFHWALLANPPLATRLITALGPETWCREMIHRWAGSSSAGLASLQADGAVDLYAAFFAQHGTLQASCEDYKHGATTDVEREAQWQREGRRIRAPLLLLYSQEGIGARYLFPDVWREWVGQGVAIESFGLGVGVGHFGAEEAPEECARQILGWLRGLTMSEKEE